jgi:hypothetical protein
MLFVLESKKIYLSDSSLTVAKIVECRQFKEKFRMFGFLKNDVKVSLINDVQQNFYTLLKN